MNNTYALQEKTWNEHIYCSFVSVHGNNRKSYVQFTDPTCPNNSLLVFNYALPMEDPTRNPFRDFNFSKDIPNPVLRGQITTNPEKPTTTLFEPMEFTKDTASRDINGET